MMTRRGLFLDRDGTLIRDVGYPKDPDLVELLPGSAEALAEAKTLGFRLVIVSNQSGVARGLVAKSEAEGVQRRVEALFAEAGITFDGAYFCFHGPDEGCACRKPASGLLRQAALDLGLELSVSVMVGDKPSDVQAGHSAGCATIAFGGTNAPEATARCASWSDVTGWLRAHSSAS